MRHVPLKWRALFRDRRQRLRQWRRQQLSQHRGGWDWNFQACDSSKSSSLADGGGGLGAGCWWLVAGGCWWLVAGGWLLVAGWWWVVAGGWLLVAGLALGGS